MELNKELICKYSLENAFQMIISIFNEERDKHDNTKVIMSKKIEELETKIGRLKEENDIYQSKITVLQTRLKDLTHAVFSIKNKKIFKGYQNMSDNKIEHLNSYYTVKNNISPVLNNNINDENNSITSKNNKKKINNYIKLTKKNISYNNIPNKNKENQNLFYTKKPCKRIELIERDKKHSNKSMSAVPVKINRRNIEFLLNDKDTDIDSKIHDNFTFNDLTGVLFMNKKLDSFEGVDKNIINQNKCSKRDNSDKSRFNIIEKKIQEMKDELCIFSNNDSSRDNEES